MDDGFDVVRLVTDATRGKLEFLHRESQKRKAVLELESFPWDYLDLFDLHIVVEMVNSFKSHKDNS
jgi:hypothetical protein